MKCAFLKHIIAKLSNCGFIPHDLTKSTLVQVMAWCRQAPSHYLNQCWSCSVPLYSITSIQWVNNPLSNWLFDIQWQNLRLFSCHPSVNVSLCPTCLLLISLATCYPYFTTQLGTKGLFHYLFMYFTSPINVFPSQHSMLSFLPAVSVIILSFR